ncbi:MAG TPA: hypothetical protein PKC28_03750 [Bdellovibrionales bacterium]|nr:hypothetical protein [Bdellovibrionales bacterium]
MSKLCWLLFLPFAVHAAPMPGTGSSALVGEKPGLFHSHKGFLLHSGNTAWLQTAPPKNIPSLVTIYKSPLQTHGQQPALSVRVDELRRQQPLKNYVRRWMQDYTRFGFDVLTAKPIKINQQSAFLLDIVSRETQKQLRQVVFMKNKTAVILTCRDHRESFPKTVQDCNQIVKTFSWTE